MKNINYYIILCLLLISWGCTKELPRDNPHDENNPKFYKGGLQFSEAVIFNDNSINGVVNSNNGVVNIDEHIHFKVNVQNITNSIANSQTATLQYESNPDIANFRVDGNPVATGPITLHFPQISPGYDDVCSELIDFDVLPTAKDYEKFQFSLKKTDQKGNTATDTFTFIVKHFTPNYDFKLLQPILSSTDQSDGKIRPGANIKIKFQESNITSNSAYGMKAGFLFDPNNITKINPDSINFGNIMFGKATTPQQISIAINPSCPPNTLVPVELDLMDIYNNVWKQTIKFTVEQ